MTQPDEWVVTKWDQFGEPLLRERVVPPPETPQQRYQRLIAEGAEEALF